MFEKDKIEIGIIIFSLIIILTGGLWYGLTRKNEEDESKNNQLDKNLSYSLVLLAIGVIILLIASIILTRKHCPK
jgi:cytochrome c biogenesis factor